VDSVAPVGVLSGMFKLFPAEIGVLLVGRASELYRPGPQHREVPIFGYSPEDLRPGVLQPVQHIAIADDGSLESTDGPASLGHLIEVVGHDYRPGRGSKFPDVAMRPHRACMSFTAPVRQPSVDRSQPHYAAGVATTCKGPCLK